MSPIVAVCPEHGPFAVRGIVVRSTARLKISGSSTNCSTCGAHSPIMDGEYSIDSHGIATALSAPQWSLDALRAIQEPVQRAAAAVADAAVAEPDALREVQRMLNEIKVQNDALSSRLDEALRGKRRWTIGLVLTALATALGAAVDGSTVVAAAPDIARAFLEALEHLQQP
ncbi:hypothetical protein [Agrococcus sp. Marseille-Q4369]|uniref:hypothetical protein n=1 Tax=Agrococcus sp. Marseille-Q4369 TaxID=2810513 RepID=UPI001B8B0A32|nr:hypothetical protein [Agrococcus sp. Marseille-Q4369]QUW18659.1 hypothetical protein JSQ78_12860 [Agrococcus sp. Marseille-Q4369]